LILDAHQQDAFPGLLRMIDVRVESIPLSKLRNWKLKMVLQLWLSRSYHPTDSKCLHLIHAWS